MPAVADAHADHIAITSTRETFEVDGTRVVATLFRSAAAAHPLPAIVVYGPWTQVKEQVAYAYAPKLAAHGYAVLTLDHRNFGESGGVPRAFEDPASKVADLAAAIGFLQAVPGIDPDHLFGVGVCYGASLMADLARRDVRLKAFATVAAWLHDRPSLEALFGKEGYAMRARIGADALADHARSGHVRTVPAFDNDVPFAAMMGPLDYYADPARGAIAAWDNRFAVMSFASWLTHEAVTFAADIEQPMLMIHSDAAMLPDNARRFHAALSSPRKALLWMTGDHLDFYDQADVIDPAVAAIARYFAALERAA